MGYPVCAPDTFAEWDLGEQVNIPVGSVSFFYKPQPYLKDERFSNKETRLLFNLRSQCVNEFKANFYTYNCQFCKLHSDTQEHALSCKMFRRHMKKEHLQGLDSVTYNDLFGDASSQHNITKVFTTIIDTRELLRTPPLNQAYPGHKTGPVAST